MLGVAALVTWYVCAVIQLCVKQAQEAQRKKMKKAKKKERKELKEKQKQAKRKGNVLSSSGKTIDELRQERLAREHAESVRTSSMGRQLTPIREKMLHKYNSGFFKAESRTNREYATVQHI